VSWAAGQDITASRPRGGRTDHGTTVSLQKRVLASAGGASPAEFAEPVVVNAKMVGDLMDDGTAELADDLLLVRQTAQIAGR
jgi:hypothetical protein